MSKETSSKRMIVTRPDQVAAIYDIAREAGACLPALCTQNPWTTRAEIMIADELAQELSMECIPVVISATGQYPPCPQLPQYTPDCVKAPHAGIAGLQDVIHDMEGSVERAKSTVLAMFHLDHADPDDDRELIEYGVENGLLSTVMYDCSHLPFEENVERTRKFVEQTKGKTLVEGIVDEVFEAGSGGIQDNLTEVDRAVEYLEKVNPFLIVANLGTEHRAAMLDYQPEYHPERAREITAALGNKMLVLHGTSCMGDYGLGGLKDDGIIKVNVWTRIERTGAQAIARYVLDHKKQFLDQPDLDIFPTNRLRDVWIEAVRPVIRDYFTDFGYERLVPSADRLAQIRG